MQVAEEDMGRSYTADIFQILYALFTDFDKTEYIKIGGNMKSKRYHCYDCGSNFTAREILYDPEDGLSEISHCPLCGGDDIKEWNLT